MNTMTMKTFPLRENDDHIDCKKADYVAKKRVSFVRFIPSNTCHCKCRKGNTVFDPFFSEMD